MTRKITDNELRKEGWNAEAYHEDEEKASGRQWAKPEENRCASCWLFFLLAGSTLLHLFPAALRTVLG